MGDAVGGRTTRIVLADEQSLFREAVRTVLESQDDLTVVAEAADAVQAVGHVERTRCDLALLSQTLPNGDGIDATRRIRERAPEVRVIVLAEDSDVPSLVACLEAGVAGVVTKQAPLTELIDATRSVARGEMVVPRGMLGPLLSNLIRRRRDRDRALHQLARLTPREREVLSLLADGGDNDAIAQELVISPETARTHIHNLLGKLGVHSRVEAVTFVHQNGLAADLEGVRP